jgi:hypothetical protein
VIEDLLFLSLGELEILEGTDVNLIHKGVRGLLYLLLGMVQETLSLLDFDRRKHGLLEIRHVLLSTVSEPNDKSFLVLGDEILSMGL